MLARGAQGQHVARRWDVDGHHGFTSSLVPVEPSAQAAHLTDPSVSGGLVDVLVGATLTATPQRFHFGLGERRQPFVIYGLEGGK
jgi:hypothetical protein